MRLITDQNGTKWRVSIYGSGFSNGVDEVILGSVMTLSFESDSGEIRYRTAGARLQECCVDLEAISDGELLYLLNNGDEDL